MTIEQKAKAYDEAISLIKDYNRDEEGFICVKPENIFPELKESEDEKIRKGIIRNLEYLMNRAEGFVKGELKERIAWLEKQGEPTDINPSEFDLRLNKLLKQFETLPKEELASSLSFYLNVVQNDGTYKADEKQGEQKLLNNDKYQTVSVEILDRLYESEKELEQLKQREQKPVIEGTFVNVDEVREDFMQEVYRVLDADTTNDRANQIIDAFDNLPTIAIQKPANKVEPKFKVKYAGSEYNVFETKDIAGITFYGIEDEPNHIDYVQAENCEIINGGYGIKEGGFSIPTKPAMFM